ncbi:MAG: hypothetical protein H6536_01875 [Bacteroidales bacterium]|nr:hypothetical protein [Bacteroidales bacterium]
MATEGITRAKGTELEPKFRLLQALCLGKTADLRTFKTALEKVSTDFAKTEEGEVALGMVNYLNQRELLLASGQSGIAAATTAPDSAAPSAVEYTNPSGEHIFVLVVPKRSNINQLKFNLVSFNVDYFIEADLAVNNQPLSDFIEIISVTGFKDEKVATKYYNLISKNDKTFGTLNKDDYQTFIISLENFAILLNDKSVADYLKFFKTHYNTNN